MKVGINLLWLVPGVVGGSEESTTRALHALADRLPRDVEIVLYGLKPLRDAHPDLIERFETHTFPLGGAKPARVAVEHTWLPLMARRHRLDLLHDAGGTAPGPVPCPRVVTVHDIQPIELPRNFSPVKAAYLRWAVPHALRKASHVVVPSAFVRDRLCERLGVDPALVSVVPWSTPPLDAGSPIETVRARYGIIGAIVLLNAITYPHKDHATALRAFKHIANRHGETTLVLTGGAGPSEAAVRAEIASLGLGDRVVRTGRVPAAVMRSLIDHASVVLVPSRYEGFGVPALEAMAAGTPVIVADAGALPEVVGDAAVVVPAGDDVQLAVELHRVLEDADHAEALGDAGRQRAASFSPERTAEGLLAAYRSVAADL